MNEILYFENLNKEIQMEIIQLVKQRNNCRIKVIDDWVDDNLNCILVRFDLNDIVRCKFLWLSLQQASAFYYPEAPRARDIILDYLDWEMHRGRKYGWD